MADVAEIVSEVQVVEKEVDKKAEKVEKKDVVEEKNGEETNGTTKLKENGQNGEKENGEATEVAAAKRKSTGGGDTPDVAEEGATPEKKAKISKEAEKEEEVTEATNGEAEVVA